jgi:hypothetical protein
LGSLVEKQSVREVETKAKADPKSRRRLSQDEQSARDDRADKRRGAKAKHPGGAGNLRRSRHGEDVAQA